MKNKNIPFSRFIFIVTIINILFYHFPFFKYIVINTDIYTLSGIQIFLSALTALFVVTFVIFSFVSFFGKKVFKTFLILVFISNSIALYFVLAYNVVLDKSMMGNVFNTRYEEASSYFNINIFIYILIFGVIPSLYVYKVDLLRSKALSLLKNIIVVFLSGVLILYINSFTWVWLDKNAKILGALSMPWSYTINSIRYKLKQIKKSKKQILLPKGAFKDSEKTAVVLVIGESARAYNFSLYGYDRQTNKLLSKNDIAVLKNSLSASTYTTASVHAILSYLGDTDDDYEVLPNYIHRMGGYVEWRTKNWGEPNLNIDRYIQAGELKKDCSKNCEYDEILLTNLGKKIEKIEKDKILIILHTAGSHGPKYTIKYPENFEIYKPVCKSVNLKQCTQQSLINAYDNTIVYTDYFLNKAINILKSLNIASVLIYISDHGESLGEYGLYLHGTPYAIAPDFQKKIPFIVWESEKFKKQKGYKKTYVRYLKEYGHYNIFHSVVGALNLDTPVYDQSKDIFFLQHQ